MPSAERVAAVLALGLRRGEALGLTWQDVNLDTREIVVTWQL